MRTAPKARVVGFVSLLFCTGCVHFADVTYPTQANATSPPSDIRIHAREEDKSALSVALVLQDPEHQAVAARATQSFLTDAHSRRYALELTPGTNYAVGDWHWSWFGVRAQGPSPEATPLTLKSGRYTIAVAYDSHGEQRVAQTDFQLDRRSVPFIVAWFTLLIHPIGPCG
jgi:hypothetical protein